MSLLPKSQQYREDILCWPLGPANVKPVAVKVDLISAFEKGDHGSWIGALEMVRELKRDLAEAKPSAGAGLIGLAPPSPATPVAVPTFKPWDRVRITCEGIPEHGMRGVYLGKTDTGYHLVKLDDGSEGCWAFDDSLELIPSEPKEADGWVTHDGGPCPVLEGTLIEVRLRTGNIYRGKALISGCMGPLQWIDDEYPNLTVAAYRLVKQQ